MLQLIRQPVEVAMSEHDLITPVDAANLSGRKLTTILGLMAVDSLPTFVLPGDNRQRRQKFTSRRAVEALPKVRRPPKPRKPAK